MLLFVTRSFALLFWNWKWFFLIKKILSYLVRMKFVLAIITFKVQKFPVYPMILSFWMSFFRL